MTASNLPDPADRIPAPSHHDGTDTEKYAAQMITPRAGTLRGRALAAIAAATRDPDRAGLTDHELADTTEVYLYSIAPRRSELVRLGWVEDSGFRRESPMARPTVVWSLSPAGRRALANA